MASNKEPLSVCDSKVLYDSQFEAEVGAAKYKRAFSDEMMVYPCRKHFHIAHKNREKRVGNGGVQNIGRCPHCKQLFNKKKGIYAKHQLRCKLRPPIFPAPPGDSRD